MLIHSIMPEAFLRETPALPECTLKRTQFGHVEGFDTPQGFCVSRIHTTDLRNYLDHSFAPGSIYKA